MTIKVMTSALAFLPPASSRQGTFVPLFMSASTATSISPAQSFSTKVSTTFLDPLIVCGPSGVGKGTIIARFMEEMGGKDSFEFSISHTTRAPRKGEVNGKDYFFVGKDVMKNSIAEGNFLEYAEVHGNLYGTSWSSLWHIHEHGKRCILDIDIQGVLSIKGMESEKLQPKYIFIAPPSLEVLKQRLISRGTESAESLAKRTANAREELEYGLQKDNFHAVVVNENLDNACKEFSEVVRNLFDL